MHMFIRENEVVFNLPMIAQHQTQSVDCDGGYVGEMESAGRDFLVSSLCVYLGHGSGIHHTVTLV